MVWWPVLLTCLEKCSASYYEEDFQALEQQSYQTWRPQEHLSEQDDGYVTAFRNALVFDKLPLDLMIYEGNVLEILAALRSRAATNARDKVYATLSFCTEDKMLDFRVNYSRSVTQVFTDIVAHILGKWHTLDFLAHCYSRARRNELPSRVPDWSDCDLVTVEMIYKVKIPKKTVQISYHAGGAVSPRAKIDTADFTLTLQGVFLHSIYNQTHTYSLKIGDSQSGVFMLWLWCLFHFARHSQSGDAFHENSSFTKAFVTVLAAGKHPLDLLTDQQLAAIAGWIEAQPQAISARSAVCEKGFNTILLDEFMTPYKLNLLDISNRVGDLTEVLLDVDIKFESDILAVSMERNLAITSDGGLCLVPGAARGGDEIFVPVGGSTPLVLRRSEIGGDQDFILIGECYVYAGMNGGHIKDVAEEELDQVVLV